MPLIGPYDLGFLTVILGDVTDSPCPDFSIWECGCTTRRRAVAPVGAEHVDLAPCGRHAGIIRLAGNSLRGRGRGRVSPRRSSLFSTAEDLGHVRP